MFTELVCMNDSRRSFYGKAHVYTDGGRLTLQSYDMRVAYIEGENLVVLGTYSPTTLRHIKEFALQNGFEAPNKRYIEEHYIKH